MNYLSAAAVTSIALISGCATIQPKTATNPGKNNQEYLMAATLYTQNSGEFKALCYQAYEIAEQKLISLLDSQKTKPAIVLDLDETVLDNSPYTAWQIKTGNSYSDETWEHWTDLAKAEAIPGAVKFLKLADSLGVSIFYITNRLRINALNSTIENMNNLNLPQADEDHLFLKTTTSDKSARRDSVLTMGYSVLLYIGDNLGDFSAIWDHKSNNERNRDVHRLEEKFGNQFIILPNSIYGTWESAIYNFDHHLSEQQKDSLRKATLAPADL